MVVCLSKRKSSVDQNPGSIAHAYPCGDGKCREEVLTEGIQCDDCSIWYHQDCSKLSTKSFKLYCRHESLLWTCPACKQTLAELHHRNSNMGHGHGAVESPGDTSDIVSEEGRGKEHSIRRAKNLRPGSEVAKIMVGIPLDRARESMQDTVVQPLADDTKVKGKKALANKRVLKEASRLCGDIEARLSARLASIESILQTQAKQICRYEKLSEVATGRIRNVVINGIPEPFIKQGRLREHANRFHLINLLRLAELPGHTGIKRMLRLGKWQRDTESNQPRPLLVEFANPRHRDSFLAAAGRLKELTKGGYR